MVFIRKKITDIHDLFGDIVILEGESNPFNEYNELAIELKEVYEEIGKGDCITSYGNLYTMSKKEIEELFKKLLTNKNKSSIILNSTGFNKGGLEHFFSIANGLYQKSKNKHSIAYIIEQTDRNIFKNIAKDLKIKYISNLDMVLNTETIDGEEFLSFGYENF